MCTGPDWTNRVRMEAGRSVKERGDNPVPSPAIAFNVLAHSAAMVLEPNVPCRL